MTTIVDFLELDHMRETIRAFAVENGVKLPARKRQPWDKSGFYIGRTVVRFYFNDVGFLVVPGLRDRLHERLMGEYGLGYTVETRFLGISLTQDLW